MGQLVAWHPPDALLRTVGMLCFGSVSMLSWQPVDSANPNSVKHWDHMGQVLILRWSWVQRWWVGLALPTMACHWAHLCAPWVCRPWVFCAVCLNQWRCPSHSQSQLTVTLTLQPRGTLQGEQLLYFIQNVFLLFLISRSLFMIGSLTVQLFWVFLFCSFFHFSI